MPSRSRTRSASIVSRSHDVKDNKETSPPPITHARNRRSSRSRSASSHDSLSPRRGRRHRLDSRSISRSRSRSRTPYSRSRSLSSARSRDRRNGRPGRRSRSPSRGRYSTRSPSRGGHDRRYRDRSYTRSPTPPRRSSKIIIEKLTKNVNEDHLREIFGTYGEIQSLELPMNRQFMTNRGTAYIHYFEATDAEAAIAHMHEAQLDGAVLNVSIVLPRRTFSRSPPPARSSRHEPRRFGGGYGRGSALLDADDSEEEEEGDPVAVIDMIYIVRAHPFPVLQLADHLRIPPGLRRYLLHLEDARIETVLPVTGEETRASAAVAGAEVVDAMVEDKNHKALPIHAPPQLPGS